MKDVLLPVVRRFARTLLLVTISVAAMLFAAGEVRLIGGVLAGYAAGAAILWGMSYRVWRSAGFPPARARREMLWGLALRLMTLFLILSAAAQISPAVFWAAAGGCLLFYALFMLHLIAAQGSQK
ncbi:hypothetical protein HMPREF9162_0371 [Selenomonas sp. oral taxon 137 str. F0430]|jgi:hypothetical protein|uniref:hypothetical protein n=1 Tax=Selenomonas TaxID=970 RepID=UPI0001EB210F|nr:MULTISPECIES: hypothetical protein [Selenomonas]EFR39739.1 hypothetical protein HMPREF9162_0371 [Selenomonas sp. oral taxon 137 str. F0430]EJP28988.1 hypothetical protein HMPREF1147_0051 [Selenomonas sp. FOBRC9]